MEYPDKNKVLAQFKELLPWDKLEFIDSALNIIGEGNLPEYLFGKNGGWNPLDFTTAKKCVEYFDSDELLDEMYDSDVETYIESHPSSISSYYLIEALKDRWNYGKETYVSDSNLEQLEKLVETIKKYKEENKK